MKIDGISGCYEKTHGMFYGLPADCGAVTDFDLIEMDEGRWYPDMWRDAWK